MLMSMPIMMMLSFKIRWFFSSFSCYNRPSMCCWISSESKCK